MGLHVVQEEKREERKKDKKEKKTLRLNKQKL